MNKAAAGKFAIVLFWHAVDIAAYGIALMFLWGWFVVPSLHASVLTMGHAFGLVIITRMLFAHSSEEKEITFQNLVMELILPALFTEAGYLVHHFIK